MSELQETPPVLLMVPPPIPVTTPYVVKRGITSAWLEITVVNPLLPFARDYAEQYGKLAGGGAIEAQGTGSGEISLFVSPVFNMSEVQSALNQVLHEEAQRLELFPPPVAAITTETESKPA